MQKMIFWEMNEVNFEFVNHYIKKGKLPNWKNAIEQFGLRETYSETIYENIEPWIQWPSVRTGLEYSEHNLFRLGDVEKKPVRQHWEILEDNGFSVAAISPINATNNTKNSDFWMPDPWVSTACTGDQFLQKLYAAIKQAVNDNAQEKLSVNSIVTLLRALLLHVPIGSVGVYLKAIFGALCRNHWSKAILLDRLIADVFIEYYKSYKPDFSVIFLNGAAHVQHHYMCNSEAYAGKTRNPNWYIKTGVDPVLQIYQCYDSILKDLMNIDGVRILIATGMRQVPHEKPLFYWRLKNHASFFCKLGLNFESISPRMTRDFHIEFSNDNDREICEAQLLSIVDQNSRPLFGFVEKTSENSLFVTLTYDCDVNSSVFLELNAKNIKVADELVFVAIKNGMHDTKGYYIDTERSLSDSPNGPIHVKRLFDVVMNNFKLNSQVV